MMASIWQTRADDVACSGAPSEPSPRAGTLGEAPRQVPPCDDNKRRAAPQ